MKAIGEVLKGQAQKTASEKVTLEKKYPIEKIAEQYGALLDPSTKLTRGFIARAMVLASMPHSEPKETFYNRENGQYRLTMIANPNIGLPYGPVPRLLFAWMTTEVVRTKKRTLVLGKSLSAFMRQLDLEPKGGVRGTINTLKEQMIRLFSSTISCTYSDEERAAGLQMQLVDSYDLWWTPKDPKQLGLQDSTIVLSEKFFLELTTRPVVFYMEALKTLRKSPMALDIYMWLTYKNSYSRNEMLLPWESLQLQFGAGYPTDSQGKADFKRKFMQALKKVSLAYPEAKKLKALKTGLKYVPGEPHVPKLA